MHKCPDKILSTQLPASPHLSAAALLANVSGVLVNITTSGKNITKMHKNIFSEVNTDWVLDYARPQPPNMVNVGGLQIRDQSEDDIPGHIR